MSWQPELDELRTREAQAREMGGADKVKRQHDGGRLTVRERIDGLLDPDSFHEVGAVDSIADICGAAVAWDLLGVDRIYCSPVPTGSGFITLAATLASTGHVPVAGMALILGVDRFMSEARAITNFIGNTVATLVIAKWDRAFDATKAGEIVRR